MPDRDPLAWRHATSGVTRHLVDQALAVRVSTLPDDVRRVARDCLVDWLGCCYAGLDQPVSRIVSASAEEEGGHPQACVIGRTWRGSALQAALVNGTTSHALDYDDVNLTVPGHMSAAILPALVALSEQRRASVESFYAAFVAGYEFACRVGTLVEPAHYANGFHATATVGGLGAAMACAHLLRLSDAQTLHAIGIAATQAAGLKAMFGSMAKPLHAGLASQSGLRSALLAQKGLISRTDALECVQGFVQVHGQDFHGAEAVAPPNSGFHLYGNLFKFHAACYSVHSTLDATAALRLQHRLSADAVRAIEVVAGSDCSICNIQDPRTGLEAKFSLRASAAFALLGMDTSRLDTWERVGEPEVAATLRKVEVELVPGMGLSAAVVTVHDQNGSAYRMACDCGVPIADKVRQSERVVSKFRGVTAATLDGSHVDRLLEVLEHLENEDDLRRLTALCGVPGSR